MHRSLPLLLALLACLASGCDDSTAPPEPPVVPPVQPPAFTRFAIVSAGGDHTCAADLTGRVYCWGLGTHGRLGTGATDSLALEPRAVSVGVRFFEVAAGDGHVCGTAAGGALYCWGLANQGQVGNRSSNPESSPFHVREFPHAFVAVSAGHRHSCAIGEDLRAYCWGWNFNGQLGNASEIGQGVPVPVASEESFAVISAGSLHSCGITTTGRAYCWGEGASGQLGNGAAERRPAPVPVSSMQSFAVISAGGRHTCGLTLVGEAYCWGAGSAGQLGNGELTNRTSPTAVSSALRFSALSAGDEHTCAVDVEGVAHCWGHNNYGRLGRASLPGPQPAPARVLGDIEFAAISAGRLHTCGLGRSGALYCWGFGGFGQLGTGYVLSQPAPVQVAEPVNAGG
jgi:alpha-tubulin suppressor-like RCC1 family protein